MLLLCLQKQEKNLTATFWIPRQCETIDRNMQPCSSASCTIQRTAVMITFQLFLWSDTDNHHAQQMLSNGGDLVAGGQRHDCAEDWRVCTKNRSKIKPLRASLREWRCSTLNGFVPVAYAVDPENCIRIQMIDFSCGTQNTGHRSSPLSDK